MSLSEWLGLVQALATVVALFFAWRAVAVASETRREAAREQRLARLERLRASVGELERLKRFSGDTRKLEAEKERLTTLTGLLGGHKKLPATTALAHWHPHCEDADELMDTALLEVDNAIDKASMDTAQAATSRGWRPV